MTQRHDAQAVTPRVLAVLFGDILERFAHQAMFMKIMLFAHPLVPAGFFLGRDEPHGDGVGRRFLERGGDGRFGGSISFAMARACHGGSLTRRGRFVPHKMLTAFR